MSQSTHDLIYDWNEVERRGLFAFFIPSVFTPLHDTRMEQQKGVTETKNLTPLQWQLIMKCWKMNLRPGQASWWAPTAWRLGAIGLWAWKLRKLNGPGFTWPMFMFANALPESLMAKMGKIHLGRPIKIKTRKELLATIKPHQHQFLRADTGDIPEVSSSHPSPPEPRQFISLVARAHENMPNASGPPAAMLRRKPSAARSRASSQLAGRSTPASRTSGWVSRT